LIAVPAAKPFILWGLRRSADVLILIAGIYMMYSGVPTTECHIDASRTSNSTQPSLDDELTAIARQHGIARQQGKLMCVEAARAIANHLERINEEFLFAEIWFQGSGRGGSRTRTYIVSDTLGADHAISNTGYHVGILHNGIIRCNIHPEGLPREQWYNDFHGIGARIAMENPVPLGPEFNPFSLLN